MLDRSSMPLDGAVREAAQAFFRTDLSEVVVHRGDWYAEFGAAAFAFGTQIYMPVEHCLSPSMELELLGHELAHIVQQKQGRVRTSRRLAGLPANDDPALEQEAISAGWNFAHGQKSDWPHRPASTNFSPVVQRSVSVAGKRLRDISNLGVAGTVLGLVNSGNAWLMWAIGDTKFDYSYPDEGALLTDLQRGLHGIDLMLLPRVNLQVHPIKLLEMGAEDLSVVTAVITAADANPVIDARGQKVLERHQLWSQADLAIGTEFLMNAGVVENPVFRTISLPDRIALFNLVGDTPSDNTLNQTLQKEAAAFAVGLAQTPSEFVDYYQFYFACLDETDPAPARAAARTRKAESLLTSIQPLLFDRLSCPTASGVPTPDQMHAIICEWLSRGKNLGFARLSLAMAQIARSAGFPNATAAFALKTIEQYYGQVHQLLAKGSADETRLSQDGAERSYFYKHEGSSVEVSLASDGRVSLRAYQPGK